MSLLDPDKVTDPRAKEEVVIHGSKEMSHNGGLNHYRRKSEHEI
jgi:hypothetical protein